MIQGGKEESDIWSVTGMRNHCGEQRCEDVLLTTEYAGTRIFGIADGQSQKKHSREGAEFALQVTARYIAEKTIPALCQYHYIDEIQFEIIRRIREKLLAEAQIVQTDVSEFSSTLIIFAVDIETNMCISVHLGDGAIVALLKNDEVQMISPPDNSMNSAHTWLTTSVDAICHLRLSFGNTGHFKRVVLFSDGADTVAYGRNLLIRAKKLIQKGSRQDILNYLAGSNYSDDASCIIIDYDNNNEKT